MSTGAITATSPRLAANAMPDGGPSPLEVDFKPYRPPQKISNTHQQTTFEPLTAN
jgi:hypothetical protein